MTTKPSKKALQFPDKIKLNELEILRGDNIHLRMANAKLQIAALQEEQLEFKASVEKRLKIDNLERYIVNRKTGEGRLARKD